MGKAAGLRQLDVVVVRIGVELPVRCYPLLRALALRAPGLYVDSERRMVCGIFLGAIVCKRYDEVPGVGCSTAIGSETVI